jgi:aspartokinase-like uncharacterized kinase
MSALGFSVDVVVKLGGGLLAHPAHFDAALAAITSAAAGRRLLIVPGGGPFADTVRHVDRQLHLSDDSAHWMAVLAMDQHAHLLVSRLAGSVLVADAAETAAALGAARLPVLAPSRWMREADPLPHSWDVTSDSIAAWVAGAVGSRRLVLVKPPGAPADNSVDAYFHRALPTHVTPVIVAADRADALQAALRG